MNRAILSFTLKHGAGTVTGDDHDTVATLLAALLLKWPGEVVRVWNDDGVVYS